MASLSLSDPPPKTPTKVLAWIRNVLAGEGRTDLVRVIDNASDPLATVVDAHSSRCSVTPRQLDVLMFWMEYRRDNGIWPTLIEAAAELGVSKTTIFEHLEALERRAVMERDRNRRAQRSWRIVGVSLK